MADITAGLPTLRPEDIQAQQDRARIEALGATIGAGAKRLGAAALDIGSLPVRGILGAANTALRVPNAFGAGIPYAADNGMLSSLTPFSDRLDRAGVPFGPGAAPVLPAMTAPAPGKSTGGATGSFGDPVAAVTPAPVQASTVSGTPKSGGTKTPAGMPAGAPAPLIPGETGFYMNDQLVPYGTRFLASGDGTVRQISGAGGGAGGGIMDGLPGGGKMVNGRFADPRDELAYGAAMQREQASWAIREILSAAGSGGELGFGSKIRALAGLFGPNNFGANAVSGANSLNSAIASLAGAEAGAGATMGAAQLRHEDATALLGENAYQFDQTPKAAGQTSVTDAMTGLTTNQTSYAVPAKRGSGGMPQVIDAAKPPPKLVEGMVGMDKKTNKATIVKDGKWVYQ